MVSAPARASVQVSSSRGQSIGRSAQIPAMPCHVIVRGMQPGPRPAAALAEGPLNESELKKLHAFWRAANYLSVGQIYLLANPLLREPLQVKHIKPRLLGHWGTTPGLNFLYAHLNRVIKARDLDAIFICGPGHGGPGMVANAYLEGTYSEVYPAVSRDAVGLQKLFRQFSFPGGIPSHDAPETPGSIHEGGELGYALTHAYGAAFDNPDLKVFCVIGDGEAETGPLAASWHANKFLDPITDGAVLPILHLNGWKIANPTVLARIPESELRRLLEGYGYMPYIISGDDPMDMHQRMAAMLDLVLDEIEEIQGAARKKKRATRPQWPMIVMRTPKGWTGPKVVDGVPVEGTWRSHQVPVDDMTKPEHLRILDGWLRSYRPDELFDENGTLKPELAALPPTGQRRMSANPHTNGGELTQELRLPDFRDYAVKVDKPGTTFDEATKIPWRRPIPSFNYLLSSHVWRQDHNGFTHQDPGFIDVVLNKKPDVVRVYLAPDTNCLLSIADHCVKSRQYVNVIVAGKQRSLNYLSMDDAIVHCTRGIGIWDWASNDSGEPDVVMACAGDIPTLEALAATDLIRKNLPDLKIRVVNVVDLMKLQPEAEHPHGLSDAEFDALFTTDKPVIFAYHGYPWLIHRLTYRRKNHANLHVRGYKEEGTTTTPFDMVMLNDLDRFHLVIDVIDRVPGLGASAGHVRQHMVDERLRHRQYTRDHGEDMPDVRDWTWPY